MKSDDLEFLIQSLLFIYLSCREFSHPFSDIAALF